jgi:hypothetical protein
MKKTIETLGQMENAGLFRRYAIGGGVGAMFYLEAFATYDLDVFVLLDAPQGGLVSLEPIYAWLGERGHIPDREQVLIFGVPVQFLPAYNALVEEAVEKAVEREVEGVAVKVASAEHLAAIMIQTGRPKDLARLAEMKAAGVLDAAVLGDIMARHGLRELS